MELVNELLIKPAIKAAVMFCVMEGLRRLVKKKVKQPEVKEAAA